MVKLKSLRSSTLVSVMMVFVIGVILALAAESIFSDYQRTLAAAERRLAAQAELLAAHDARSFEAVEILLRHTANLAEEGLKRGQRLGAGLSNSLKSLADVIPQIRFAAVVDIHGDVVEANQRRFIGLKLGDRQYFQAFASRAHSNLYFGVPLVSRGPKNLFVPMARRVNTPDGKFGGIVLAAVLDGYFQNFYKVLKEKEGIETALVIAGDTIFAASPDFRLNKAGATEPKTRPTLNVIPLTGGADSGVFRSILFDGDVERIGAFRKVPGFPAMVFTTITSASALGGVWRRGMILLGLVGGACVIIVLVTWGLARQSRKRDIAEADAREKEERYALAVAGTNDGIWDWDVRTGEDYFSPRWKEILGYRDDELEPHRDTFVELLHPDDRERVMETTQAHLDDRALYDLEYRLRTKSGDYLWVRGKGQAVWNDVGKPLRMAGSISNITERKNFELERELSIEHLLEANRTIEEQTQDLMKLTEESDQARHVAEAANRAKSEFLANMSHELRTPLNAIIGFSETIHRQTFGPVGSRKYLEYVEDINQAGRHLLEIINDILDLSKIEAGKIELHEEAVNVSEVVGSCILLVNERAEEGAVDLKLELADDLAPLYADERMLKQILINLLSNAIKFTAAGGKVEMKVWSRSDAGYVFQIADTGIGIALEDIPTALSPFKQVDGELNRKFEGTGLGLPLGKSLVELHGGSLDLQSEVGVGTTVTVRFPAERIVSEAVTGT